MLTYPTPRRPPCPPSRSPGDHWSSLSRGLDVPNLTKRCGRFVSTTLCPRRFDLRLHIHREHEAGKTETSSSSPCTTVVAILRCFISPTKSLCRGETCSCFAPPHPLLRTSVTQQPLPLQQRPCPSSVLARVWISSPHTLHLLSHAAAAPSTPTIAARRSALGLHDAPYTQWRGANFLATGEHNGHGGGCPSLRPVAGPRRKVANDTVEPILFLKPTSSFLHAGVATVAVEIPEPLKSLHHKAELAVVISWRGHDVPEASAMDFVRGNREPTQDNLRLPEIKGKFDPSKAAALGLRPGPKYRELQVGNSIQSDQFDEMHRESSMSFKTMDDGQVLYVVRLVIAKVLRSLQSIYELESVGSVSGGVSLIAVVKAAAVRADNSHLGGI
uniref:Fumarylacetoacetase-like C-terminal domain-containing protein n=1 Tax=Zea mays TaxID=4577 RepID=A0A804UM63_MAIZE